MPFEVGESVGSYRITDQLGLGGMASVYKAYHAALDRYVAIKVLHLAFHDDQDFIARFRREARLVARLDHPNIVPVYDFAEYEGQPYLVMKFIEGETLKERMQRGGIFQEEILPIVEAVGAALTYAHHMNVLHRDIKPSNIMLARDGQIYLADFGLAKMTDSDTGHVAERLEGTPSYISPEQAQARPDLDVRTDVYSFGVMLYELMVGRVPFSADSPLATIREHLYTPPPLPRQFNPAVSEAMEQVLLKALAKDRRERFRDVRALVDAFRAALTGQPLIPEGGVIIQASEDEQLVFVPAEPTPFGQSTFRPAENIVEPIAAPGINEPELPPVKISPAEVEKEQVPLPDTASLAKSGGVRHTPAKKKGVPSAVWIVLAILALVLLVGSIYLITHGL
jgi:serine/threonine protein kinase